MDNYYSWWSGLTAVYALISLTGCAAYTTHAGSSNDLRDATIAARQVPGAEGGVFVSRNVVRVVFPVSPAPPWDSLDYRGDARHYVWSLSTYATDGQRTLFVNTGQDWFRTVNEPLVSVVARAWITQCLVITWLERECDPEGVRATVVDGRIVLTLQGPPLVRRLFGLRQDSVSLQVQRPLSDTADAQAARRVAVRYVDPQLPTPDSAFRAAAASAQAEWERRRRSIRRFLESLDERYGPFVLQVGDTLPVRVGEIRCTSSLCTGGYTPIEDDGWSLTDSAVAVLLPPLMRASHPILTPERWSRAIVGVKAGSATIMVHGIRGPNDTIPTREPPTRNASGLVVVTERVARIDFSPLPDTILAGTDRPITVRLYDASGALLPHAPVGLIVGRYVLRSGDSLRWVEPGEHVVTVSYAGHTASTRLVVLPPPNDGAPGAPGRSSSVRWRALSAASAQLQHSDSPAATVRAFPACAGRPAPG